LVRAQEIFWREFRFPFVAGSGVFPRPRRSLDADRGCTDPPRDVSGFLRSIEASRAPRERAPTPRI